MESGVPVRYAVASARAAPFRVFGLGTRLVGVVSGLAPLLLHAEKARTAISATSTGIDRVTLTVGPHSSSVASNGRYCAVETAS